MSYSLRAGSVQWKTPDDGQRNCPKHAEFYSKNKFEKLVHLVGFIVRTDNDARSPERQMCHILPEANSWNLPSVVYLLKRICENGEVVVYLQV